jgi:peroxiredoxin Q/BCP
MPSPLQQGDMALDFTMSTDGGGDVRLADFRGDSLVLYFYPKDDTPGCTTEALDFTAHIDEFERNGTRILGVSPDSPTRHDKFKAKHGLGFTLASDEDNTTALAYGVWGEKSMYGRKYMGIERSTFLIDGQGRIARVWNKVKVAGHVAEVLDAVQSLSKTA